MTASAHTPNVSVTSAEGSLDPVSVLSPTRRSTAASDRGEQPTSASTTSRNTEVPHDIPLR